MSDLISREKAYEVLTDYYHQRTPIQHKALREALDRVPSAEPFPENCWGCNCPKMVPSATQTNAPNVLNALDCVSRQSVLDAIDEIESEVADGDGFQYEKWRQFFCDLPSADIDLSDYSDRLWRNAYERGKADAEPRWISVEDEPPKEKKRYWVCTDTGYQCECRWTNNVYGLRDSDNWWWSIFDIPQYTKVVAYMPLPEPWKGEGDAEID